MKTMLQKTTRKALLGLMLLLAGGMAGAQVLNPGFDEKIRPFDDEHKVPLGWHADSYFGFHLSRDAYKGPYALMIHGWYNHVPTRAWSGPVEQLEGRSRRSPVAHATPIDFRPVALNGFFKHTDVVIGGIPATATVLMLRETETGMDTVGTASYEFYPTKKYRPFSAKIKYKDANTQPTHVSVSFYTGNVKDHSNHEPLFNYLYIDALEFVRKEQSGCAGLH